MTRLHWIRHTQHFASLKSPFIDMAYLPYYQSSFAPVNDLTLSPHLCHLKFTLIWSYLIIDTSFAPSPMARVTADFRFFTISTTRAFCKGVTRQQITAMHCRNGGREGRGGRDGRGGKGVERYSTSPWREPFVKSLLINISPRCTARKIGKEIGREMGRDTMQWKQ